MPLRKTDQGWYWGSKGPFPSKDKALAVARAAYASGYKEKSPIRVIIGPPCSGKSTYAKEKAIEGEVIVDFDELAKAIGNTTPHKVNGTLKELSFYLRHKLISKIINGIEVGSYIIHTRPNKAQIEQYKKLNVEFIILDPGKDTCVDRAKQRPEGTVDVINKWYETPPEI